ncbi:hypothetical protein BAUCODRAFT_77218 [Baudoinia panamericana UAMH 10762]|uniref:BTB domain-containing protein n=1 Tax=Baudoinia panamericana (strain UAMH 10762) TaxID=717646 RepID=M2M9H2_BAUPA|nr:uncharacterized protein BAUCODRAFT_77218 [Baudoinia panamericana UAMH 10762]EMC93041.1 hypothetical protein BAUCODRAFT_77218 [Baudoinia panamericana UAMH 10762]
MLAIASSVLRVRFDQSKTSPRSVLLLDEDGDTVYLLVNIIHLRNDKLPARLAADALCKLANLAHALRCVEAVKRASTGWFDWLYTMARAGTMQIDTWRMIHAAYTLDEPVFFARFTEKLVKEEQLLGNPIGTGLKLEDMIMEKLAAHLQALRADFDIIIEPCSIALSKEGRHHYNYAPGMEPDEPCGLCHVDDQGATLYLGTLRDEGIWPPTVWKNSLGEVIDKLLAFRIPDYDDCDKCDFCAHIKTKFAVAVGMVKKLHQQRLWGMCLDCFKADGRFEGDCRVEHIKARAV